MKLANGWLAALAVLLCSSQALAWEEFTSEEGGFTVEMPTEPDHQEHEVPTEAGNLTAHMFMSSDENSGAAYYAAYNDFPEEGIPEDPEVALDGARDGMLANTGAELVSEETIEVPVGLCREIKAASEFDGQTVEVRVRVLLVENRLYQLGVIALGDTIVEDDIETYFESFKLTE